MATASKFTLSFLALAALSFSGCAAACKNFGCSDCGPIAIGGGGCDSCTGCGELYVDPWINHPPDCCDPCDTCGNYNGQSCGTCRPLFAGIGSLWGYRHADCGGCDSCALPAGCDSCGIEDCSGCCEASCGCDSCAGSVITEGDVHIVGEPTYSDEIVEGAPGESYQHYQPYRTRKIFRPRPHVAERHPGHSAR